MSEISVQCKYMLRVNIRTPLNVIFGTKNIIGRMFRLSTQYVSQLLTVLNQKLNKTVILTCRCSICIENESTGKYTCSHAPYTRFTSVKHPSTAMNSIHCFERSKIIHRLLWSQEEMFNYTCNTISIMKSKN